MNQQINNVKMDVVDMEFVIHIMEIVHVILDIQDQIVVNIKQENVQKIVEDKEYVKLIIHANVILVTC